MPGGCRRWCYAAPRNNGGDGYVIARALKAHGFARCVWRRFPGRKSAAGRWAAGLWDGEVQPLADAQPAPLLIDALFGTGLTRPLDEAAGSALCRFAEAAAVRIAVDLPSGVATDDGSIRSPVPDFHLTVTFTTLKPSHLLQPSARRMGRLVVADIGIVAESRLQEIAGPRISKPGPDDHKYTRGYVAVLAGEMTGATALSASAALRAGAGYDRQPAAAHVAGVPDAVVQGGEGRIGDPRIGAVAIGPGLGGNGRERLEQALGSGRPLVLDADALMQLAEVRARSDRQSPPPPILTPHAGEFARLYLVKAPAARSERTRHAAERAGAVVVFKGPDHGGCSPRREGGDRVADARLAWPARARATCLPGSSRRCGRGAWTRSRRPAPASGCTAAPPSWRGRG